MSLQALSWAFKLPLKPASLKLTLIALVDHANAHGMCYPSLDSLVAKTSLDRKTVIANIDKLEEYGFLGDTGKRTGATGQIKIYRLLGFDAGDRHYTYRVTDAATGEFYIGVRSCYGEPARDDYFGSGRWPLQALKDGRKLTKVVLQEHETRLDAEIAERDSIKANAGDPLLRNLFCNGHKNGTVPIPAANSTVFPEKGAVFSAEQSQKRDTESPLNPSSNLDGSNKAALKVKAPRSPKPPPEWVAIAKGVPLPEWLPRSEWTDYVDHRLAVKCAMTERAAQLAVMKLEAMHSQGLDAIESIRQTVRSGKWTDLYEPKALRTTQAGISPREQRARARAREFSGDLVVDRGLMPSAITQQGQQEGGLDAIAG